MPIAAWPLIEVAIEPKSEADRERLDVAIAKLASEDPDFSASTDPESGLTILKGTSELHLDAVVEALKRAYTVEANVGASQVAYREKLGRAATIDHTHKRQGASPQFARVVIAFAPADPGRGFKFENAIVDDAALSVHAPSVERGLILAKDNGLLAGFPVIDFSASLIGGACQEHLSNDQAFQVAAQGAFRQLKEHGDPRLLEPVMKLAITCDEDHIAAVVKDLDMRRGVIQSRDVQADATLVIAHVPLANMFGYVNTLSTFTQSRASYVMEFSHYQEVPLNPGAPDLPPAQAAALRA